MYYELDSDSLQEQREEQLIAAAKRGEHQAYAELFRRHSKRTMRVVQQFVRSVEDAEDVMQDAMMKAFIHLAAFDGRSAFSTWLTRIAINTALMMIRKRRNCPESSMDDPYGNDADRVMEVVERSRNPEEEFLRNETDLAVRRAVNRLSTNLRCVMEARHLNDASIREISTMLGISDAAAKSRLLRGRAALKVVVRRWEKQALYDGMYLQAGVNQGRSLPVG